MQTPGETDELRSQASKTGAQATFVAAVLRRTPLILREAIPVVYVSRASHMASFHMMRL